MWDVKYTKKCASSIKRDYKNGFLTQDDLELIAFWESQISQNGPESIEHNEIWRDHPLEDKWEGYRSSSFSPSGRIIYKIYDNKIQVLVVKVTPDHDYEPKY